MWGHCDRVKSLMTPSLKTVGQLKALLVSYHTVRKSPPTDIKVGISGLEIKTRHLVNFNKHLTPPIIKKQKLSANKTRANI